MRSNFPALLSYDRESKWLRDELRDWLQQINSSIGHVFSPKK